MIYIRKDTINPILLQLSTTSLLPEFYFKFENVVNDSVKYFISDNMSQTVCVWDIFELIHDSSLDTNIEFINDEPCNLISGQWTYYVISTDTLPIDLEEAIEMDIKSNYISIGKMVVEIENDLVNITGTYSYYDIPL